MNIGEEEVLVKLPHRPPARLAQCRYYADPEVMDRAPARGENWIPPLGPARADGALEPPVFPEAPADEDAAAPAADAQERGAGPGAATGADAELAAALAEVERDDDGNQQGFARED